MAKDYRGQVHGKKDRGGKKSDEAYQKRAEGLDLMRQFAGIVDSKGRLQFASEATVEGLGYSEDEILRKPFWEASWFAQSTRSQKTVKASVLEALAGESVRCEVEAFTKEGTAIPVTLSISSLKGKDGEILNVVAEAESLVEAREIEMLRESGERLTSVFELIEEVYFEVDSKDRLTMISPSGARVLGYKSPEDVLGKRMAQFW